MSTFVELFAGAGGMSSGLERAGWTGLGHAEIEPHARAVLRDQWPEVPLYGDVRRVVGANAPENRWCRTCQDRIVTANETCPACGAAGLAIEHLWRTPAGITLLTGGSPCQDLSIAGKRAGLQGARSGLFHEQVRIWRESGAQLMLWENVLGALSSNYGEDFATVLGTLVGATVRVPRKGNKPRWGGGGRVVGPAGVAAWRVLDAQYFGVAQRRRRVFVVCARAGSGSTGDLLSLCESLLRDPETGEPQGQDAPATAGGGAGQGGEGGVGPFCFALRGREGGNMPEVSEVVPALRTPGGGSSHSHVVNTVPTPLAFHPTQDPVSGEVSPCLGGTVPPMGVIAPKEPLAINISGSAPRLDTVMATLQARSGSGGIGSGAQMQAVLPTKSDRYFVDIHRTTTGETRRVLIDKQWSDSDWAWWAEGNMACDCNRASLFGIEGQFPCDDGIKREFLVLCVTERGEQLYVDHESTTAIAWDDRNQAAAEVHHTLRSDGIGSRVGDFVVNGDAGPSPLTFDARGNGDGKVVNTMAGDHQNRITDYTAIVLPPAVVGVDRQQALPFTDVAPTMKTDLSHQMGPIVAVRVGGHDVPIQNPGLVNKSQNGLGIGAPGDAMYSLESVGHGVVPAYRVVRPDGVAFAENQRGELRLTKVAPQLSVGGGKPGQGYPAMVPTSDDPHAFRMLGFGHYVADETASAIKARDYKDVTDIIAYGAPRRLLPIECERLMGWTDNQTKYGVVTTEDYEADLRDAKWELQLAEQYGDEKKVKAVATVVKKTEKALKKCKDAGGSIRYELSDTPRYKLCGNGVASPVLDWIGTQLRAALIALESATVDQAAA